MMAAIYIDIYEIVSKEPQYVLCMFGGRQLTIRAVVRVRSFGGDAERLGEVVRPDRVGESHPLGGCQREPTPTRGACYVAANRGIRESDDVLIYGTL